MRWFASPYSYHELMQEAISKLAKYVSGFAEDIVLIDNVSAGINTIFEMVRLNASTPILELSLAYGMVRNVNTYVSQRYGAPVQKCFLPFPSTPDDILSRFEAALDQDPTPYIVVIDHITSFPAMAMPVKEMVAMANARGVITVVDGAHALGQVDVNVTDIDADFYTANGHKWLLAAAGSAFLHAKPKWQSNLHPVVISTAYGTGYQGEFEWIGTRDYTSMLTMTTALAWRQNLTDAAVRQYNHNLCLEATKTLESMWDVQAPLPLQTNLSLSMMPFPCPTEPCFTASEYTNTLRESYNIYTSISNALVGDDPEGTPVPFIRLSCQVYNSLEDYERLGNAVLDMYASR